MPLPQLKQTPNISYGFLIEQPQSLLLLYNF